MNLSTAVRQRVLDRFFKGTTFAYPTTWWVALHTEAVSSATPPSTVNEHPRQDGYARVNVTTAGFGSATTDFQTFLTSAVQFPDPTDAWSSVNGVSIHDSSVTSGGSASTAWFVGALNSSVQAVVGNPVRFSSGAGGLEISVS